VQTIYDKALQLYRSGKYDEAHLRKRHRS
jgi:hypothetical protein